MRTHDESMKNTRGRKRSRKKWIYGEFTRGLTIEMVSTTKICNKEIRGNCDWKASGEKKSHDGRADDEKKRGEARG